MFRIAYALWFIIAAECRNDMTIGYFRNLLSSNLFFEGKSLTNGTV